MPTLRIAHLQEQGQDLIIVPLEASFGHKTGPEQQSAIAEIQIRSRNSGLRGRVVPVWDSGGGKMAFIAPRNWHPFFCSINLTFVWRNLNRELRW